MALPASLAQARAERRREAALVVLAVVLVHLGLLAGGWPPPSRTREAAARTALMVRRVELPRLPTPAPPVQPVPSGAGPEAPPRPGAKADRRRVAGTTAQRQPTGRQPPEAVSGTAPLATADPRGDGAVQIPTYPTRIAPAFRVTYHFRRGTQTGIAELDWQPSADGYQLELRGNAQGVELVGAFSRGSFDAAGLAPERFVDRRRGRDRAAASFDRALGRITYSGPQVSHPLHAGAQDRLSWMLQLAAIVEADPPRFGPGERVTLFVAGTRGEADPWVFVVKGSEIVELAEGVAIRALHLRREADRPYDLQADVWLDPARHHLPARALLVTVPEGYALDLALRP